MRLLELTVKNVRGLPDLHLRLEGKNIVIWGPNGAGKSCVVDAIDFLFTGRISRLMGEGTAGINLPRHGPHIDHEAESAFVKASVQLEGIPQAIELRRCMAQPDDLICPDDARDSLAKTRDLMRNGGVILTRRDILRYVTAEAGKRASDIEEILHLKDVHDVRSSLIRARTELNRQEKQARGNIETAKAEVNVTLGLPTFRYGGLLQVVNESRAALGGTPVDIKQSTRFKEGISTPAIRDTDARSVNSTLFQQAIQNVRRDASSTSSSDLAENDSNLRMDVAKLKENPGLLAELERLDLTEHASQFIEESTVECPVCGASWPEGDLKARLAERIDTARAAGVMRKRISGSVEAIETPTRTLRASVSALADGLRSTKARIANDDLEALDSWVGNLTDLLASVSDPLGGYLDSGLPPAGVANLFVPHSLSDILDRAYRAVQEMLPKPTLEQTAWDKLTQLQESVRIFENRVIERGVVKLQAERSKILLAEYEKARDTVLEGLYSRIAGRFVEVYRVLHANEAGGFGATLQPQRAGLSFEVDFMGHGSHPPHALHSEGHQDSMGVCLFLALNEELVNGELGFIVFDDVIMSVDTGHRKDVCGLLADQFSHCQFIITTHDRTWAKQLRQGGVVAADRVIEFTSWTLEGGPNTRRELDLWERIEADLAIEDIHGAAFRLRRGSEEFFEDVCSALGAQVTYNSEMQWQLDDWLPGAMVKYKELVASGRRAAASWGDEAAMETFREIESVRKQIYRRTFVEQWSINAAVHFNNWGNMSKEDFLPVVDAFRDLYDIFQWSTCRGLLEKIPRKGRSQIAKCRCGNVNWNLRHNPS